VQHPFANRLGAEIGSDRLRDTLAAMRDLVSALAAAPPQAALPAASLAGQPASMQA